MATTRLLFPVHDLPEHGLDVAVDEGHGPFREALERAREGKGSVRGRAVLRVEPTPERIEVKGHFEAELPLICSRCADEYRWSGRADVDAILLRAPEEGQRGDGELLAEHLDQRELVGDQLDLAALLTEELILAVPEQPLCREGCQGICPGCGAELNREPCTCGPKTDHRWSKLADWGKKAD